MHKTIDDVVFCVFIHGNIFFQSFHMYWLKQESNIYFPRITQIEIYEARLFVCLYLWHPPNQDASNCVLGLFGKLFRRRGALAWFHGIWTCGVKVLEYWIISSLKIKLNQNRSWKFWRNWNVPLMLLERSWWAGFNGIYLVRFGFRMWEILIFKWFLPLKINSNKFQKPGFGMINQLRTWQHLKAYQSIQAWFPFVFGCSKNRYIHCKTMFACWVSLFCNEFQYSIPFFKTLWSKFC